MRTQEASKVTSFLFDELGDDRCRDWPLMRHPGWILLTISVYLVVIYILLPRFMERRAPYELKRFIQYYNIFQVVACSILVYGVATSGWTTTYTFGCQPMDYSENPIAVRMLGFFWWNMMLKFVELIETVIFALRKKYNQISGLHVYHHASTLLIGWMSCKYGGGGMMSFTILLNGSVHVLMYTYYFLASLGPEWQNRLTAVKSKLTIIQLAQLIILFFHISQALPDSCEVSELYAIVYMPLLAGNIILFLNFYVNNYTKKTKKE